MRPARSERAAPAAPQRRARLAATAIVAAMFVWMAGSWAGGALGLPVAFAFALDVAALAVLLCALVVLAGLWRGGREADR